MSIAEYEKAVKVIVTISLVTGKVTAAIEILDSRER